MSNESENRKGYWYYLQGFMYCDGNPHEDSRLEFNADDDVEKVIERMANTIRSVHEELSRVGICDDGISCEKNYESILNENGHCEDCVTERDYENDKFPKEE